MAKWKPVDGYEELYIVSDEGEVYALPKEVFNGRGTYIRKGQMLKPGLRGGGKYKYKFVSLTDGKTEKHVSVHRIVALAFVENPNNCDVVNHIDRDTKNNKASNLEWCDQQYNVEYGHNKRVAQFKNGIKIAEYKSVTYASEITKIGRTSISNALKGWSQTAGGYEWEYIEGSDDLSH